MSILSFGLIVVALTAFLETKSMISAMLYNQYG